LSPADTRYFSSLSAATPVVDAFSADMIFRTPISSQHFSSPTMFAATPFLQPPRPRLIMMPATPSATPRCSPAGAPALLMLSAFA
jgi:hypothetical protein